jgi:hypothetical protein
MGLLLFYKYDLISEVEEKKFISIFSPKFVLNKIFD